MRGHLEGLLQITITSADFAALLTELTEMRIALSKVSILGDLQVSATVRRNDIGRIMEICQKRGAECRIIDRRGLYWNVVALFRRPILMVGVLMLLITSIYLPSRVLFLRVEGNEYVPEKVILEYAEQCGLGFGAKRSDVRSEKLKNALLEKMPQLQWVGINTAGCVATISVTEREISQESDACNRMCHLVSSSDGVIVSATGTAGTLCVVPGQAVKKGQILVSGYTDCGNFIHAECAQGEVYAQTRHDIDALTPAQMLKVDEIPDTSKKYSLVIGKNRINLYKGSGILDGSCVKMYVYHYLTLPGGFQLPIGVVEECWTRRSLISVQRSKEDMEQTVSQYARSYVQDQMIAGQILAKQHDLRFTNECCYFAADYVCLEMIARVRQEEIFTQYGEND